MRYYVRNPISLGAHRFVVRVVGERKSGELYVVPRGRVVEVPDGPGGGWIQGAVAKWTRNLCIEPYDPERHKDAILEPTPEIPRVTPAWFAEEEARRVEMEDEMREAERRR